MTLEVKKTLYEFIIPFQKSIYQLYQN